MADIYGYQKANGSLNSGSGIGGQHLYYRGQNPGARHHASSGGGARYATSNDLNDSNDDMIMSDRDDDDRHTIKTNTINDIYNRSVNQEQTKGWDVFVVTPPEDEDETLSSKWIEKILKMLKLITFLLTFVIVLSCAVLSKSIVLFMTSMIRSNRTVPVCAQSIPGLERDKKYIAVFQSDDPERVAWIWSLFFVLIVPELMTLFRSARICTFKSYRVPSKTTFIAVGIQNFQRVSILTFLFPEAFRCRIHSHHWLGDSYFCYSPFLGRGQGCHADQLSVFHPVHVGHFLSSIR